MSNFNLVIFGYPCIGKSTLCSTYTDVFQGKGAVDLESSIFKVNGNRDPNWYIVYSEMAAHISRQNKIVFMSTHPQTRNYIYNKLINTSDFNDIDFAICIPDLSLKDFFIERATKRYESDPIPKNFTALTKIKNNFVEDIELLYNESKFDHIILKPELFYKSPDPLYHAVFDYCLNKYYIKRR